METLTEKSTVIGNRVIKARAISEHIATEHLAEAIHYRSLDREAWAG